MRGVRESDSQNSGVGNPSNGSLVVRPRAFHASITYLGAGQREEEGTTPRFSYHRTAPPAPVQTRSTRLSPLMSALTQPFIADWSSTRWYFHSPFTGSSGA